MTLEPASAATPPTACTTPLPAKIYAGEGIAQILFFRGEAACRTSYADKKGKYQHQKGLTLPFVTRQEPPASQTDFLFR